MWAIVSMLAVMKTGAAFVSLDPNYPKDRLSFIIQQTEAQVVLGNASTIGRVDGLVEHQLTIDASWFETHDGISTSITPRPTVGPSDTAFLLFTSGSTGMLAVFHLLNANAG